MATALQIWEADANLEPLPQIRQPGVQARVSKRRTSATVDQQALFLCSLFAPLVAVCGRVSALPGSFCPGLAHPHAAATHHVQVMSAVPQQKEPHHGEITRPQSVRDCGSDRCSSCNGTCRPPRRLKPFHPYESIQPPHELRPLPGAGPWPGSRSARRGWEMSAQIIPFPGSVAPAPDALDELAARLSLVIADLPPIDDAAVEQLKLLRRIDRKLGDLVKMIRQGGAQ